MIKLHYLVKLLLQENNYLLMSIYIHLIELVGNFKTFSYEIKKYI